MERRAEARGWLANGSGLDVALPQDTSRLTLKAILADPAQVAGNLRAWIAAFDPETRLVFADRFIKSIAERMDDNADIFGKILD